jgi:hypothetical protein
MSTGTRQKQAATPFHARLIRVNAWLETRLDWAMWAMVLIGLYLRVRQAGLMYFNTDEAQIMLPPLQHGLANVYKAALPMAHAPLVSFLLHFMTFFGNSELYFRMPEVLCGALLAFVGYKWAAETFGKGAGLVTGCFIAFAPPLVVLSASLRSYMIQALFMVCSLYCLERAFREKSARWMGLFSASALLATLTDYMSVFYLAALGIYAGIRILRKELPRPLVVRWAITQAAALTVLMAAYFTQFRNLRGNLQDRYAHEVWLPEWYFRPHSESLLHFLRHATLNVFRYAFANGRLGPFMLIIFLVGVGFALLGKNRTREDQQWAALSLLLPLIVTAAAGVLTIYPYGGSRHDAFLLVFISAGVSIALSVLARGRVLVLLLGLTFLLPVWLRSAERHIFDDYLPVSRLGQMKQALAYLSSRSPRPKVLMADFIAAWELRYYVCRGQNDDFRRVEGQIVTTACAGYRIITFDLSGQWYPFRVPRETFPSTLAVARSAMPNDFVDPVWVFNISFAESTDELSYDDTSGKFGRLELYRLSP